MNLTIWQHYFIDLPRWAAGLGGQAVLERMLRFHKDDLAPTRAGLQWLWQDKAGAEAFDTACRHALRIKVEREADAYRVLAPHAPRLSVEGLDHLHRVRRQERPLFLLTGHFGSFYTIAVALARHGIAVHPVARTVDTTAANPRARRLFEQFNYASTARRMAGHYLYTDFSGRLDKRLVTVCRQGGVVLVLPDLPQRLFGGGRQPVSLFGHPATLPARLFELGHKYEAQFVPVWSHVDHERQGRRTVTIEPPLLGDSVAALLQGYADSLTRAVCRAPWQWMALPIITQYLEADASA